MFCRPEIRYTTTGVEEALSALGVAGVVGEAVAEPRKRKRLVETGLVGTGTRTPGSAPRLGSTNVEADLAVDAGRGATGSGRAGGSAGSEVHTSNLRFVLGGV